jgi:RNA-directed DNA polymerase
MVCGWHVLDADIKGFFDNVDHEIVLKLVQKRISDKRVVKLIRGWLEAGVIGEDWQYQPTVIGTPQGGVISPLLANIYLHVLDRYWQTECAQLGTLVRYCDDFVIVCREAGQAREAMREA